ncbi:hypothetical protein GUJ93_ZPchr0001g30079 [Zizania palustris]|uniref:Uncharacterized protein n=1 Tax=Zizania palustris TaxID=103762 RepID=A0A8J5RND9_ZIZPA|nr:hypothetical protein GUJ93_ZPchr0001g30079 [Zizania palustris]
MLSEVMEEPKVVEKMLRNMIVLYKQIVPAIQTLLDPETLPVVELTGHLKADKESFEATPATMQLNGKLYLTK